jgi:hypothetical protein
MTRRELMLAVINERNNEMAYHIFRSWSWWTPTAWYHSREVKRLHALQERDLAALPPARYRQRADLSDHS